MPPPSRLAVLVSKIEENQRLLEKRAQALGVSLPTLDEGLAPELKKDLGAVTARQAIIDSTGELDSLVQGSEAAFTTPAVKKF